MSEPLENLYFNWLCAKVVDIRETSPGLTYWTLLGILHRTEFVWLFSGDDNRAEDGKDLRRDFLIVGDIPDDLEWRTLVECSLLEMLIAFARRAQDMTTDISTREWFWEFMDNLRLKDANDANIRETVVEDIVYNLLWRTYAPNGDGGLFPMRKLMTDQRKVEIWGQFCDYLIDQNRLL